MKIIDIEPVYEGKFLKFYHYKLDDGRNYEVVSRHPVDMDNINSNLFDAVDIIAFDSTFQKILVVKEWRPPVNDYIYAFPAGLRDAGETIVETATRELLEETRAEFKTILKVLPPAYQSAGMTNETVASVICIAQGKVDSRYSSIHEDITPLWLTKAEVKQLFNSDKKFSGRCQMVLWMWAYDNFF